MPNIVTDHFVQNDSGLVENRIVSNNRWNNQRESLEYTYQGLNSSQVYTPSQTTTISDSSRYVKDISLHAYMREIPIDFVSFSNRPNRRVYFFFDDVEVTNLIQKPNVIELDDEVSVLSLIRSDATLSSNVQATRDSIIIGAFQAEVLFTERANNGNTIVYTTHFRNRNNTPANGEYRSIVTGNGVSRIYNNNPGQTTFLANVVSFKHFSGVGRSTSNGTTITLSMDASTTDNYYFGNVISIMGCQNPGQTANIVSYNGQWRRATVSPALEDIIPNANLIYSIGDSRIRYASDTDVSHYTTEKGFIGGTFHVPGPIKSQSTYRFRTGERIFSIMDNPTNDAEDSTTRSYYKFNSAGLDITSQQLVINTVTEQFRVTANVTIDNRIANERCGRDPIAQSFYVSEVDYPKGIFVPFIDVYFRNKGTLPIEMQIRPMVNGFPSSKDILPNAIAILESEDVVTSELPDVNDSDTRTRFTFVSPVYLLPGQEYAIVLITNDYDYDVYVSELGEKIIGTERLVSQQPYLGSFFKSQSTTTYTPIQSDDLMFVVHKCIFQTEGSVVFHEKKDPFYSRPRWNPRLSSNLVFDAFEVQSDSIELPGTGLAFSYRAINNGSRQVMDDYVSFKPETKTFIDQRKFMSGQDIPTNTFDMRVDLSTTDTDISPIIYKEKQNMIAIRTMINNLHFDQRALKIVSSGNNYTTQNTSVSISSSLSGSGANAKVYIRPDQFNRGQIGGLILDGLGSSYYDNVSITITSTDANSGNALLSFQAETEKSGGPARAKYISRTVTLAPEFDAGDLRVFLTAIKPPEANIQVYYKVRNSYDNEPISQKPWTRMVERQGIITYSTNLNPIELEFRPSLSSNTIVYSTNNATFDTFNQFKIKIVLASTDTVLTKIPYVYDMIATALPGEE